VISLPEGRTLIALADVSGKGMAAALLSANIQALVRSMSSAGAEPLALAKQINQHLCRHTPSDFFATAVFLLLNGDSGEVTYVNAGHNAPIVFAKGRIQPLGATGIPLGLFPDTNYEARTAPLDPGASVLLFTDGLTDSIGGDDPEIRVEAMLQGEEDMKETMLKLRSLMKARLTLDDVTIVLVARHPLRRSTS